MFHLWVFVTLHYFLFQVFTWPMELLKLSWKSWWIILDIQQQHHQRGSRRPACFSQLNHSGNRAIQNALKIDTQPTPKARTFWQKPVQHVRCQCVATADSSKAWGRRKASENVSFQNSRLNHRVHVEWKINSHLNKLITLELRKHLIVFVSIIISHSSPHYCH